MTKTDAARSQFARRPGSASFILLVFILLALLCAACSVIGHLGSREGQPTLASVSNDTDTLLQHWFAKYLEHELPVLTSAAATDWGKVNALRNWTYANTPRAAPSALLEHKFGYAVNQQEPYVVLFMLQQNYGGFYCAGTSKFLAALYRFFGYDAYWYNMGTTEGSLSHVVTLVQIRHNGEEIVAVQDAYFNFALSKNAQPLDFLDLLASLEQQDLSEIHIEAGDTDCKPVIVAEGKIEAARAYHKQYYSIGPVTVKNGHGVYCHDFSVTTYEDMHKYRDWLKSQIGKDNILYLFLFPINTSGGTEARELARKATEVRKRLLD